MIRVTLDTNTLASGAVAVAGPIAVLFTSWRQETLEVVLSFHIVSELESTLRKPYFARRLDERTREDFLLVMHEDANIIPITTPIPAIVSSRADNLVLATAESGNVDYIVTGDKELLRLGAFHDIAILSPRAFLDVLAAVSDIE